MSGVSARVVFEDQADGGGAMVFGHLRLEVGGGDALGTLLVAAPFDKEADGESQIRKQQKRITRRKIMQTDQLRLLAEVAEFVSAEAVVPKAHNGA